MSRYDAHSDVDRVRESTDLAKLIGEHVKLEAKGREHVGLCPFHDDKSPSMHVVTHKGPGFYKCFACGASGDCFTFVKEFHGVDFREALQLLADRAGIPLQPRGRSDGAAGPQGPSRSDLLDACRFAGAFFQAVLKHEQKGAAGRAVVEQRGIAPEMVEAFGLGYAPPGFDNLKTRVEANGPALRTAIAAGVLRARDGGGSYDAFRHRLMFPICDEMGRPVAFGARAIDPDDQPKYLNSPESRIFHKSRTLFGLHNARTAIVESGVAIVTEGYTDVIACHQAGVANVVGTLGTALTSEHADRLSRHADTVALVFDGDEAGQRAADRSVAIFFQANVDVRVCVLPGGQDPDDFLKASGAEAFRDAVANGREALAWKLDRFRAAIDPAGGVSARQKSVERFLDDLAALGFDRMAPVRRQLVLGQLEGMLRIPARELDGQLRDRRTAAAARAARGASSAPAARSNTRDAAARDAGPSAPPPRPPLGPPPLAHSPFDRRTPRPPPP